MLMVIRWKVSMDLNLWYLEKDDIYQLTDGVSCIHSTKYYLAVQYSRHGHFYLRNIYTQLAFAMICS